MNISITKLGQTEYSTVSKIFFGTLFIGFVIEDGERMNKIHGSTRIDAGTYKMVADVSTRFTYKYGYCWHIIGLPRHLEVKIHKGNTIAHTSGCLLPNTEIGIDKQGNWYGRNSKKAYDRMMKLLPRDHDHTINIFR